jgi:GrpB-like predicted nucleotidyltransferase (UPF0157 family)
LTGARGDLGLAPGALRLVPHDPTWARLFDEERARLSGLPTGVMLHHIGSTSVPDLPAKPILDLMAVAEPTLWPEVARLLIAEGYGDRGRRGERGGHVFIRQRVDGARTHNLHLHAPGDPEARDHLDFIAALQADAKMRNAYAARKADLIAAGIGRAEYAEAKGGAVAAILTAWRAR